MRIAGVVLLACGCSFGQATFEVASIKPAVPAEFGRISIRRSVTKEKGISGRLNYQGISLKDLIGDAYHIQHRQIAGPDWLSSQRFDISAVISASQSEEQIPEMLGALLRERFGLKAHRETKDEPVYRLVAASGGSKLPKAEKETGISAGSTKMAERVVARTGIARFAEYLSERLDRTVVDQTGLAGVYSFRLEWTPDSAAAAGAASAGTTDAVGAGASIFTAIQEQLGLRLVAGRAAVGVLVVDGVEKYPTEN